MRGALRIWFYFWHRLSFLNTEALFCQIMRSSQNGPAFVLEWAFRHSGYVRLTAYKKHFAFLFAFHLVESSKLHHEDRATISILSCLHILAHALTTIKILPDKDALRNIFLLTWLTFYLYLFSLGSLFLTFIRKSCSKFSNYSIFLIKKMRVKEDDWNIWDYCFSYPLGFWNFWTIHNSFLGMNTILLAASKSW